MVEDREIVRVTSQAWCDQLAEKLLQTKLSEGYHSEMRSGKRTVVVEQINVSGKKLDPYADMQRYVDGDQPVPVWIARSALAEHQPKKGGRHTHLEQWAAEKANAISCWLAMDRLLHLEPSLSQTAAGIRIGRLRGKSYPAVVRAWKMLRAAK